MRDKEIIKEINEVKYTKQERKPDGSYLPDCDGYEIITNLQKIKLLISNGQDCCEYWGYLMSQDDFSDFIGATLLAINKVDEALNVKAVETAIGEYGCDQGGCIFINIETNKGTLQFTAYNSHNGYYGHSVFIESNQFNLEDGV